MRYLSFIAGDRAAVGVVRGDQVVDLTSTLDPETAGVSPMRRLLVTREGSLSEPPANLHDLPSLALVDVQPLAPVPDPGKVVAAPVNYFDHKAEMNQDAHIDALGVFLKAPSSVVGPGTPVELPYVDRRFDQEGELAVVIGRRARHVPVSKAAGYVAGYTCLLDMTMRGGEDRSTRKSFDTFTPMGPHLVTPDEVGDLAELRLRTWVGEELRQDADISDLIWGVPQLIAYVSSVMTLEAGDVVSTGTPAGVGQVQPGNELTVEITNLGRLRTTVTAVNAVTCPTKGADRGPKPPPTVTPVRQEPPCA